LVGILVILSVSNLFGISTRSDGRVYMLGAIILAGLLISWRAGTVMIGIAFIIYSAFGWLALNNDPLISGNNVVPVNTQDWFIRFIGLILLGALIVNGIRLTQTEYDNSENRAIALLKTISNQRASLEKNVLERTAILDKRTLQLRAVADIGKSITSYRNLSELLQQATNLIHENFNYYHIGIFLLDERKEYAVLAATNSVGGRKMLERGHQLKVGETGIVGFVAEQISARIALDVGDDAVFFNNPDLPETRSEMALPLVASGQILGVLDVQSTEPRAFVDDDIATLQILAEQLAIAIQNANLFSETAKALDVARATYGEISREAWNKILRSQEMIGFLATPPATVQITNDKVEPVINRAIESGDLILGEDGLTISVPVKIRGQVIGAIRLKKSEIADAWTQDETNLAVSLSDQLSGALESARLYRDSQQRAAREALVSEISARITASATRDAILRETVQELGQTIGNVSVTFQLLDQFNSAKIAEGSGQGANARVGE
jgi:GAF domain-containing protein